MSADWTIRVDVSVLAAVLSRALDGDRIHWWARSLTSGAFDSNYVAAQQVAARLHESPSGYPDLLTELDRACRAEISLVGSLAESEVIATVSAHKALHLRRHGARLMWALLRDERSAVASGLDRLVTGFQRRVATWEAARADLGGDAGKARWEQVEALLAEVTQDVSDLEGEVEAARSAQFEGSVLPSLILGAVGAATGGMARPRPEPPAERLDAPPTVVGELPPNIDLESAESLRHRVAELEADNRQLNEAVHRLRELELRQRHPTPVPLEAEITKSRPVVDAPRRGRVKAAATTARVGVFVDVANLAGAARLLHGKGLDFRLLLTQLLAGRRLVEARAYAIDKGARFDRFARALRGAGYQVAAKKPKTFRDGTVKADWDVGICVDVLTLQHKLDVVVLATGDGDFVPLVQGLRKLGLAVEAAAFSERTDELLKEAVDEFRPLTQESLETRG